MLQTEFSFTLPRGYVDGEGDLHRDGVMRLATAYDENRFRPEKRIWANDRESLSKLLAQRLEIDVQVKLLDVLSNPKSDVSAGMLVNILKVLGTPPRNMEGLADYFIDNKDAFRQFLDLVKRTEQARKEQA